MYIIDLEGLSLADVEAIVGMSTGNTGPQGQRSGPAHKDAALRWAVEYLLDKLPSVLAGSRPSTAHLSALVANEATENDRANARMEPQPAEPAPVVDTKDPIAEAYERGLETALVFLDKRRAYWEGMAEWSQTRLSHESAREARELANELGLARVALRVLAKGETR